MTYDMIIIGAGPAGIALAAEAISAGMDRNKIILLEKADKNSWIIRKLYPEQKLVTANYKGRKFESKGVMSFYDMNKKDALAVMSDAAKKYDMNIAYEHSVSTVQKVNGLFEVETNKGVLKSKICAIAIGIFGKPNKPGYKIPATLIKKTSFDITSTKIENSNVLVVGGGDSAAEYVQHLLADGNKLTLACRSNSISKRMNEENAKNIQQLADNDEITLYTGADILSIEDDNGKIKAIYKDENIGVKHYEHIVYALGGTTPANFLKVIGVEIKDNEPNVDENFESNIEGLFIVGDLGVGRTGGSIALAFNSAFDAMQKIKTYISDCIPSKKVS